MYDKVQNSLEKTVFELEYYKETNLYNADEISEIIETRRHFETHISVSNPKLVSFLRYIQYEMNLLEKLEEIEEKKSHKLNKVIKKNKNRTIQIFKLAIGKFSSDKRLFKQYVDFLVVIEFYDELRYFLQNYCLKNYTDIDLWIFSASTLYQIDDFNSARSMLQKCIRGNPKNLGLVVEYFKLELLNIDKMVEEKSELGLKNTEEAEDVDKIPFLIYEHLYKIDKDSKEIINLIEFAKPYETLSSKILAHYRNRQ